MPESHNCTLSLKKNPCFVGKVYRILPFIPSGWVWRFAHSLWKLSESVRVEHTHCPVQQHLTSVLTTKYCSMSEFWKQNNNQKRPKRNAFILFNSLFCLIVCSALRILEKRETRPQDGHCLWRRMEGNDKTQTLELFDSVAWCCKHGHTHFPIRPPHISHLCAFLCVGL